MTLNGDVSEWPFLTYETSQVKNVAVTKDGKTRKLFQVFLQVGLEMPFTAFLT